MKLPSIVLHRNTGTGYSTARSQRGAILFISLILLVVLSLIGIAGMQVTTLQERMAGNYLLTNTAFENAEAVVRQQEAAIKATVNSNGGSVYSVNNTTTAPYVTTDLSCANQDMTAWANSQSMTGAASSKVMLFNSCPGQGGNSQGTDTGPVAGGGSIPVGNQIYLITSVSANTGSAASANAASMSVVQSVFIP